MTVEDIFRIESSIKEDPAMLEYIQQMCWWSVQQASKLQSAGETVIRRIIIDDYVKSEIGIK